MTVDSIQAVCPGTQSHLAPRSRGLKTDLRMDRTGVFWHSWCLMKHLLSLVILTLVAVSLTSCNTISGAGQDVSNAGQDVSKAANKVKNAL